ncbi:unnamed protein product [Caenorhabditis auriculariae]|uniref:Uncharacterized protein n=1 Tax=Caenorhabditis auriculariae TaxID=2777116 RepID=A0A8S1GZA9_9PELO|nr:unnamed protein product [Caenorhabditis auriculariae]
MDDPALMPDLSHLSAEEREIIEQVFKRQRDEEAKEVQMSQKASEELEELDKQLNERKETSRKLIGTQDDAICQICQKTKFADGIGHKCFYCQLRSCARCGGRAQSKNKAIWACSLCQKRQQILAKTGKWFQPEEPPQPKISVSGSPSQASSPQPSVSMQQLPIDPARSSQQQQQQMPTQNVPHQERPTQQQQVPQHSQAPQPHHPQTQQNPQPQQQHHPPDQRRPQPDSSRVERSGSTAKRWQGEDRRQNTLHRQPSLENEQYKKQQGNGNLPQQRTTNSNAANSNFDQRPRGDMQRTETQDRQQRPPTNNERKMSTTTRPTFYAGEEVNQQRQPNQNSRQRESEVPNTSERVTEENYSTSAHFGSSATKGLPKLREDALFKRDFSERAEEKSRKNVVRAVPPSTEPRIKNRLHRQLRSMSSSEEEVEAGPSRILQTEDTVQRLTEECNSEKGLRAFGIFALKSSDLLRYIYGNEVKKGKVKARNGGRENSTSPARAMASPSRLPPSVSGAGVIPGDVLAAKIRTYLSHPVTWQPSADQKRLIGHMILHRIDNAHNSDLGLKVVGGRRSDTGRLGAFITQVKPGSVADTVGRLRPGDEVIEWNGHPLQNATYEQVYENIAASKYDTQVELIVSRSATLPGGDDFLNVQPTNQGTMRQLPNPQFVMAHAPETYYSRAPSPLLGHQLPQLSHSQSVMLSHHLPHPGPQLSPRHRSSVTSFYPEFGPPIPDHQPYGKGHIFGRIELSLVYSHQDRQLSVALERALDLPPRPDGSPRNPYVKLFLLPDRSEKSRRQSAVLAETLLPVWNDIFYYNGLTEPMVLQRVIEVTLWDYDKFGANSFLGETLVDLSSVPLDGTNLMCTLVDMDDDNPLRTRLRLRKSSYYSQYPHRPHSEMNFHYNHPFGPDYYHNYYDDPARDVSETIRRSRTYDRGRQGRSPAVDQEDWNINQPSGYLSDHGYTQSVMPNSRNRRPRSATAMRPMTREEMGASRAYSKALPNDHHHYEEEETQERVRYPQMRPNREHIMRVANGGMQLTEPQGYGSDGSETMSVHSCNSMPLVTTINRRPPAVEERDSREEQSIEEYEDRRARTRPDEAQPKTSNVGLNNMKERKKSLMTRFIPGRGAGGAEAKRTGFARSEEVGIPGNLSADRLQPPFLKQASRESTDSAHSDNWQPVLADGPLGTFVDNLGPGQVVGRQVLASPVLGEIQIGIMAGRSGIDVEVIRAKNLVVKPGVKICPAPYVKVYLMEGKQCVAKAKTNAVKKTTSPLFQQHLIFNDSPRKKMLQITVLGDYGRMERKTFMGIAQIRLDDLELGPQPLIGWYKLFHSSSLAGTGPVRKDSEVSLVAQN